MNYLAHVFLSGRELSWQLGGLLGDFIKGPLPPALVDELGGHWEPEVLAGIRLHRQLDAYVDHLPEYLSCVELLGPRYRRWGGVAMDVFFDHLLASQWQGFCDRPLPEFSQVFYDYCAQQQERMPVSARSFMLRAAANNLFCEYGDREIFLPVLERIDQRVRFETNLVEAGQAVLGNYCELQRRFTTIMPMLMYWASHRSSQSNRDV